MQRRWKKNSQEELKNYLETSAEGDNTTYQTVTIHSDADHVTWGNLSPQVVEEPEWSIKREQFRLYVAACTVSGDMCRRYGRDRDV